MAQQADIDVLLNTPGRLPAPAALDDRMRTFIPAINEVDRTIANVLSVYPELRMDMVYMIMLHDDEGRAIALQPTRAIEGWTAGDRVQFAQYLRGVAELLDSPDPELHHFDKHQLLSDLESSA